MEKSKNTLLSCVVKSIVFILILALLLLGLSYMMAPVSIPNPKIPLTLSW